MGMPNVPDIRPDIDLCKKDVVNLLLTSIALEEISLSHILNAEGEKLQTIIAKKPPTEELLKANKSVQTTLRDVIKKEMLLQFKFEDTLEYLYAHNPHGRDECREKRDEE